MSFLKLVDLDALSRFKAKIMQLIPSAWAGSSSAGGPAIIANGLPSGKVDSTSTATAFTATISGITEYYDGLTIVLKNGIVTSASGFTLNINGLGAKPSYSNMATGNDITPTAPTRDTTIFNINYTMIFVYSVDVVDGGGWVCYRGYDANTNTIGYQLRTNSMSLPLSGALYRYRLLVTSKDGKNFIPVNSTNSTSANTQKTTTTSAFDPFGSIRYYGSTTNVSSGSRPGATVLWQQYTFNIGYSFNTTGSAPALTAWRPVYLRCSPQADGSVKFASTPIVQALPTAADNHVFILLGIAYSTENVELFIDHPVYYHDGTGLQRWNGVKIPRKVSDLTNDSGFLTTETDPTVPAWAKQSTKPAYTASEVGAIPAPGSPNEGQILSYNNGGWIADDLHILLNDTEAIQVNITENSGTWHIDMDVTDLRDAFLSARKLLFVAAGNNVVSSFEPISFNLQNGTVELACIGGVYNYQRLTLHPNLTDGGMDGTLELIPTGADKITQPGSASSGDILSYNGSNWVAVTPPTGLPTVSASDNGKVLRVVNGEWEAVSLPSASGVSF